MRQRRAFSEVWVAMAVAAVAMLACAQCSRLASRLFAADVAKVESDKADGEKDGSDEFDFTALASAETVAFDSTGHLLANSGRSLLLALELGRPWISRAPPIA